MAEPQSGSGHTDTVPWDGQAWSEDPLSATVRDGRLYGRGSADMKGFIAIALAHARAFVESPAPFAVHFAFSYDEEVGCFGVKELIADMRDAGVAPLACDGMPAFSFLLSHTKWPRR